MALFPRDKIVQANANATDQQYQLLECNGFLAGSSIPTKMVIKVINKTMPQVNRLDQDSSPPTTVADWSAERRI